MKFGPLAVSEAEGALLGHSLALGPLRLRKGHVLGGHDIAALAAAGLAQVIAARLEPGDIAEDAAAVRLAQALVPDPKAAEVRLTPPQNGRVNLKAAAAGILRIDADAVVGLNRIDPAITLATLTPLARVRPGMLVGTVKIITYAVPEAALARACAMAAGAVSVSPVRHLTAGLLLTAVPGQAPGLASKGRRAVETRLRALGMTLEGVAEVPHEAAAIAAALADLPGGVLLILTGSATSDPQDVAPEGLREAGGEVARFGIPVDPGNLLFHGSLRGRPVIGLPGCARSPALNGADWFLERIACGHVPDAAEIARMSLGGLLKEMPSRPQPREALPPGPQGDDTTPGP
jgi:molybdenum cofactor cytidylyltransferase